MLVPLQCEYYALEGLSDLQSTIRLVGESLNPGLAIEGIVLCMVDPRQNLTQQVTSEVRGHFDGKVYDDHGAAQRAPVRGAVVRQADPALRHQLEGGEELPGSRARVPGAAAGRAGRRGERAMSAPKRNALGRGLAALIPGAPSPASAPSAAATAIARPRDGGRG